MENKLFYVGVKALFVKGGKALFLKNIRENGRTFWDLPGGKIKEGENIHDALTREVSEETGVKRIIINELVGAHQLERNLDNDRGLMLLVFLCQGDMTAITLSDEHNTFEWLSLKKVKQQADNAFKEIVVKVLKHNE